MTVASTGQRAGSNHMLREKSADSIAAGAMIQREIKFPKTAAAVQEWEEAHRRGENGLWKIGDALVAECGRPGRHGVNTGLTNLLKKASKELRPRFGEHYGWTYLKQLRSVASRFPEDVRTASWSACCYAGDRETLQAAQKQARHDREVFNVKYIRKYKARLARKNHQRGRQREPEYITSRDEAIRAAYESITRLNAFKKRLEVNRASISPTEAAASKKKFHDIHDKLTVVFVAIEREFGLIGKEGA